ncbi:MAG TPA: hypothetical protein VN688_29230 [Gemmataceae bacterium]|nr:hypothetical protein [Gemmataceae bacterium]
MNNLTFLKIQTLELRSLLESAGDDPIAVPQLRERLADAEKELQAAQLQTGNLFPRDVHELPRAALFLRGGGVQGSEGIRPGLAGEALIQYEKMFIEQALHDEREAARNAGRQRRPRGASTPGLLFMGTPRGSFGLEFVPQTTEDGSLLEVHARSLGNVAAALVRVAGSDTESLEEAIAPIPARVLQPLMQFLKTLAQYGAELRLAFHDRPGQSLSVSQIQKAAERLERDMTQEMVNLSGTFRGVTRESGSFDLRTDAGEVIMGTAADHLTEDDLERIDGLTNRPCKAQLQKTTVRSISGASSSTFVLLDAE